MAWRPPSAVSRIWSSLQSARKTSCVKRKNRPRRSSPWLRRRGAQLVDEAKTTAKVEGERIITGAKAEIDQEVFRAKETLRSQVAALAVQGAEKILRREVDANAHAELLNSVAAEL